MSELPEMPEDHEVEPSNISNAPESSSSILKLRNLVMAALVLSVPPLSAEIYSRNDEVGEIALTKSGLAISINSEDSDYINANGKIANCRVSHMTLPLLDGMEVNTNITRFMGYVMHCTLPNEPEVFRSVTTLDRHNSVRLANLKDQTFTCQVTNANKLVCSISK